MQGVVQNSQPLPASPATHTPKLEKPGSEECPIYLCKRYRGVEDTQADRQLIVLVEVGQVEHHLGDKSALQEAKNRPEDPQTRAV